MTTIVKIQRSLVTNADKRQQLIYNEERTFMQQTDLDPAIDKLMGTQDKVYARAKIHKGQITVLGLVRPQAW